MDILNQLLVAISLVGGLVCVILGARPLLCGEAVTAEEAVKWRRGVRKQGFDASPDMNPAITDILVRAWRTLKSWYLLCLGIGGILAGAGVAVLRVVSGGGRDDDLAVLLFWGAALYPGVLVGVIVGLARIPREPRATGDGEPFPHSWRLSRLQLVAWYPAVALVANVVFMTILIFRLAPGLDSGALARAFALPGMWSIPVVAAILIATMVSMLLVMRWMFFLAPLRLPLDTDVRQQADGRLRKRALGMVYGMALYTTWLALFVQSMLLMLGEYPDIPLIKAGLDDWHIYLYFVLMIGGYMLASALAPSGFSMAGTQHTGGHRRGEVQTTQPQP